jgi:folate-binding protein YgfZ
VAATDTDRLYDEYRALVEGCGLVDRSGRGKLALSGAGAVEFLNGQVTNELADLHPGEGRYAAFLTHKGKMLGDLRILAVGEDPGEDAQGELAAELLLDTERVALQALFDMIRRFKVGYDVQLHKRTLECALLSLIGPASREVAARATGTYELSAAVGAAEPNRAAAGEPRPASSAGPADIATLPEIEHSHVAARIAGLPARLIATDAAGVEVLCHAEDLDAVRDALVHAGAQPASEAAAEIVRVERGRPRYGLDVDDTTIPQEAGLNERAVSFTKGCYAGQETVARLHYKGRPNRHLRGLRLSAPAASGDELRLGERAVGHLGSVALSPALGPIALALVRREAEPGTAVSVGASEVSAEIVALPFDLGEPAPV